MGQIVFSLSFTWFTYNESFFRSFIKWNLKQNNIRLNELRNPIKKRENQLCLFSFLTKNQNWTQCIVNIEVNGILSSFSFPRYDRFTIWNNKH